MTRKGLGVLALFVGSVVLFVLPSGSLGRDVGLRETSDKLAQAGQQVQAGLESTVVKTGGKVAAVIERTKSTVRQKAAPAQTRVPATDPPRQPPLHGSNPHGQGTVGVVDLNPSPERPLGANPNGSDSGPEETVVGRARGEQTGTGGPFHGHITIAALFGNEVAGVDTAPGETKNGPLQPLQMGVLDPLCQATGMQVCLSVLTANSTTNANGSTNDFAVTRASIAGIGVGAAESNGTIVQDANCQTSAGSARTANVTTGGTVTAAAANSSSTSRSCRGQAPQVTNTSQVIQLGMAGLPLPAAGCANGTPDTVAGVPPLVPIICNADEVAGAAGVREALDVYVLQVATNALAKETTAAAESLSVAPPERGTQCTDGIDNDGDGVADMADPGCHTDNNANNPASFNPADDDERDRRPNTGSGDGDDDDGGRGGRGGGGGGGGEAECADGVDNDGDGVIDSRDPGCHTDGDPNNPDSYDPSDDSEGGGGGARDLDADALPFTGTDVIGMTLAGLLVLAGGLLLRRREDLSTVR